MKALGPARRRPGAAAIVTLLVVFAAGEAAARCPLSGLFLTVNSTGDGSDSDLGDGVCDGGTGACTLRAAIEETNFCISPDVIVFSIPGPGPHTIVALASLPDTTDHQGLVIDATTQPGYAGVPLVAIDGSAVAAGHGLRSANSHVSIRGLAIHGFGTHGVVFNGSHLNEVASCYIGTTGADDRGNGLYGVFINDGWGNVVRDSVISANGSDGVHITGVGSFGNVLLGNLIGTDASGLAALGNAGRGVTIKDSERNRVGGAGPGEGNVIAGHGLYGVLIEGTASTGNLVHGNRIGTDRDGQAALGNLWAVLVDGAPGNEIGGPGGAGNLVSGNFDNAVIIRGADATGNVVAGNVIGLAADGVTALANGRHGVILDRDASGNTVGGADATWANRIGGNGGCGVAVDSGAGNRITFNRIDGNARLGIDLGDDGVTANDAGDGDTGANDLQNFPLLAAARGDCTGLTVEGTASGPASVALEVHVYASDACDPSGNGEGAVPLGSFSAVTDASGSFAFAETVGRARDGQAITATATGAAGSTSELSACVVASVICTGCGNGNVDLGEDCDDGGLDTADCDSDCTFVVCGDGHWNQPAGEDCDDGNTDAGDGCDPVCEIETCVVSSLARLQGLSVVRIGGGARLAWFPDPGAAFYHVNSVTAKTGLADPRRAPGPATAECEATAPTLTCTDADAFAVPGLLFYQALSACGPDGTSEGPF